MQVQGYPSVSYTIFTDLCRVPSETPIGMSVKSIIVFFIAFVAFTPPGLAQKQDVPTQGTPYETTLLPGELWWGGLSRDGSRMPYTSQTSLTRDLWANNDENQSQPLLISNRGRYVWCEEPIKYSFQKGTLTVTSRTGVIQNGKAGEDLQSAYAFVSKKFFPPNGRIPDPAMFSIPQYNTWIELMYDQRQDRILEYARSVIAKGYPPGVLMIDDTWQENYGTWEFSASRFPDPKAMMKELHSLGFKVMVWICPFVSADSENFRHLARQGGLLLRNQHGKPVDWTKNTQDQAAVISWWNGYSALLDLTNPETQTWFHQQLDHLTNEYGVDGFKLDAGDAKYYGDSLVSRHPATPNDHTMLFGKIGLAYGLNEYRASFKLAGTNLVQRLSDKDHSWADLQNLIPDIVAQGLMGYAYVCPDMIGGGQWMAFREGAVVDQELVVRSAQVHALMPMMQFSVAPWRVLNAENNAICLKMAQLHQKFGAKIVALAKESAKTGEPIARSMLYNYPKSDYGKIIDQFMIGTDLLVAPAVQKGTRSRTVTFPPGTWLGDDGSKVKGPTVQTIKVPLERLPYFTRQ